MTIETSYSELKEHEDSPSAPEGIRDCGKKDDEISLGYLLIALAERKRTILGITAVFAILAIAIALLLPQRYTATVILLPPPSRTLQWAVRWAHSSGVWADDCVGGKQSRIKNPNDMFIAMRKAAPSRMPWCSISA